MSEETILIMISRDDRKRIQLLKRPRLTRKKWENYMETCADVVSRALDALEVRE